MRTGRVAVLFFIVLIVSGSVATIVVAQPPFPPTSQYYTPGFSIFGILQVFIIFICIYLLIWRLPFHKGIR